jgi:serine/threonine protein kinase
LLQKKKKNKNQEETQRDTTELSKYTYHNSKQDHSTISFQTLYKNNSSNCRYKIELYYGNHIEKIGEGSFGSVFKVQDPNTYEFKALKLINYTDDDTINQSLQEVTHVANIKHKNILKIYRTYIDQNALVIEMKYYQSDLTKFEKERDIYIPLHQKLLKQILYQILNGLHYLHKECELLHRDIKLQNVLIEDFDANKKSINVVIADFGVAKKESQITQQKTMTLAGTFQYLSPETLLKNHYSHKSDIFAVGVIAYQLMTGDMQTTIAQQYLQEDPQQYIKMIQNELEIKNQYNDSLIELVIAMLEKDPKKRLDTNYNQWKSILS